MLMRNMLILAIAQAGFGTPGVPVAGTNAILAQTATPSIINAEYIKRPLLKGTKGNFGQFAVGEHREIEFTVELASAGAAGSPVKYAPLLIGSGMSETISAGVSATYNLVNSGEPWMTLYCYLDGVLFTLTDAKLTHTVEANAKGIPVLKFRAMGLYTPMTDTALPGGVSFTGFTKPKTVGKVNTPTFTIHGIAVRMESFGWDLGNQLVWRDVPNFQGAICNDRMPTARAVFELTTVASKDWGETARLNTEAAMQMIHGVGAGNVVQIDAPKFQLSADPTISDTNGIAMCNTQWSVNPNAAAGNDELVYVFR